MIKISLTYSDLEIAVDNRETEMCNIERLFAFGFAYLQWVCFPPEVR